MHAASELQSHFAMETAFAANTSWAMILNALLQDTGLALLSNGNAQRVSAQGCPGMFILLNEWHARFGIGSAETHVESPDEAVPAGIEVS